MDSKFSQRIKDLRERKGLKQMDLANMLNVGRSTVSSWELGKSEPNLEIIKQLSEIFDVSVDFLLGIDNKIKNIEDNKLSLKQIPVYGYVAANSQHGEVAYEELLDFIVIPEGMRGDFGLIIKGDSMEPRLKDGDIAVVLKQPILENGEIGVIIINGNEGVVKKYYQSENAITLISLNENHPPIVIPKRNWDDIIIVGKVVGKYERWE
ncbi:MULTISPECIES: LexA family transcriptional regulator [unclassified Marinitoga]|uniref:LexA family protein n=1 Tax=unclassified Marinitoga TaxID=2640159 RepID=UPI001585F3E8|nr:MULTISPECIES: XRE family transcriptional regulator [unclassified Marinitoga]